MALNKSELKEYWHGLHQRQPGFRHAVTEDVRVTSMHRGEPFESKSGWGVFYKAIRLMWVSDAFFAHVCYRLRARLLARRVPILPQLLHKISMITSQVAIGDPVLLHPGIYIAHGQIVLDGLVEIGPGTVIAPWVSIGLVAGNPQGPTIGRSVAIGTGSTLLGPMEIGDGATIAAGAAVTKSVPAGATVAGIPAKVIGNK